MTGKNTKQIQKRKSTMYKIKTVTEDAESRERWGGGMRNFELRFQRGIV
jgi:hypothetical protein